MGREINERVDREPIANRRGRKRKADEDRKRKNRIRRNRNSTRKRKRAGRKETNGQRR